MFENRILRTIFGPKRDEVTAGWRKLFNEELRNIYSFFPLWLYSPILGLSRLHETFRFISVTRSRTVGWTPWTGDQLVARPLLTAPGDCDDD
jgi:hypothetical protein